MPFQRSVYKDGDIIPTANHVLHKAAMSACFLKAERTVTLSQTAAGYTAQRPQTVTSTKTTHIELAAKVSILYNIGLGNRNTGHVLHHSSLNETNKEKVNS